MGVKKGNVFIRHVSLSFDFDVNWSLINSICMENMLKITSRNLTVCSLTRHVDPKSQDKKYAKNVMFWNDDAICLWRFHCCIVTQVKPRIGCILCCNRISFFIKQKVIVAFTKNFLKFKVTEVLPFTLLFLCFAWCKEVFKKRLTNCISWIFEFNSWFFKTLTF